MTRYKISCLVRPYGAPDTARKTVSTYVSAFSVEHALVLAGTPGTVRGEPVECLAVRATEIG